MSGAGRKGGYRKSVTDAYEVGLPEPSITELIGRVKGCLGGNMFDVEFPSSSSSSSSIQSCSVVLPSKFRKVIWVKRGDYVIVDIGNNDKSNDNNKDNKIDDDSNNNSNNNDDDSKYGHYFIKHILNKDQIKHIKSINLWPSEFDNDDNTNKRGQGYGNDDDIMPGYNSNDDDDYEDADMIDGNGDIDNKENI